jgi:hypothetical protein
MANNHPGRARISVFFIMQLPSSFCMSFAAIKKY